MLTLCINTKPLDMKHNYAKWFNASYKVEWFEDDIVKAMVQDIDKSEVILPGVIKSPVLKFMSPDRLSGGCKGVIGILKDNGVRTYLSSTFGDNCLPWILYLSNITDFSIYLNHGFAWGRYVKEDTVFSICNDKGERMYSVDDLLQCNVKMLMRGGLL